MAKTETRWSVWMHNGRASFLAWMVALVAYIVCRRFGIDAEEVKYALTAATGVFIANLGIAQGARTAKVEERSIQTNERVEQLEYRADRSQERADASEYREVDWSMHKDHRGEVD